MISNAVKTAIKMETDAISFYDEASNKSEHPFAKEMFRGFIKDEKRHLVMLNAILNQMNINPELVKPKDAIRTVFSNLKDVMIERVKAAKSELDAIKIALEMEKEGFHFYQTSAALAPTEQERELFERLAVEENDHYSILNETYSFLDNTGQWFMYEERGIIEG